MKFELFGLRVSIRRAARRKPKLGSGRPAGRPRHEPTEASRMKVRELAAQGVFQPDIAEVIGVSVPTLTRHYHRELDAAAGGS